MSRHWVVPICTKKVMSGYYKCEINLALGSYKTWPMQCYLLHETNIGWRWKNWPPRTKIQLLFTFNIGTITHNCTCNLEKCTRVRFLYMHTRMSFWYMHTRIWDGDKSVHQNEILVGLPWNIYELTTTVAIKSYVSFNTSQKYNEYQYLCFLILAT